jgi:hypothetical protein
MRKTFEREIGGVKYTVQQFAATEGINLLGRASKLVSGPVAKALGLLLSGGGLAAEFDPHALTEALQQALDRVGDPDVAALARALCSGLSFADEKGERINVHLTFDEHFAGDYEVLGRVLAWVLEVNFSSVFRSLRSGVGYLGSRADSGAQGSGPLAP